MDIKTALGKVVDQLDLSTEEMQDVMRQIMTGQCTDAQIGGFLVALRMKSETLDEITGAAMVMRELASGVQINAERLVDTCGTGGDGANIFNVSTAAALVVAAAGGKVAKHGNRAVSGKSGRSAGSGRRKSESDARAGCALCGKRWRGLYVRAGPSRRHEARDRPAP